ncbi:hypothetical protein QJQ45_029378, partial [Haematococcus lacustris]
AMKAKKRKGADEPKQPKPKVPKPKPKGKPGANDQVGYFSRIRIRIHIRSGNSPAADPSGSSSNKRQPADMADDRAFLFDPATQMGMGLEPGAIQTVSAASGVWREDGCLQGFYRSKLTRSQVQHDSGLIQARRNTQRSNDNVKLELQHLASATPAGTSQVAIQRHVAVTLATWDAEEAASVSQQQWGPRKQLVVFFGNAGIGTRGGWGAKAVLQACRKVVERANSGKSTARLPGKVVTVDEFRASRVSSIMTCPQPVEKQLDNSKPTRLEGCKPQPGQVQNRLLRSAWSKRFEALVATPSKASCQLGFKKLRDRAPKAQAQQL